MGRPMETVVEVWALVKDTLDGTRLVTQAVFQEGAGILRAVSGVGRNVTVAVGTSAEILVERAGAALGEVMRVASAELQGLAGTSGAELGKVTRAAGAAAVQSLASIGELVEELAGQVSGLARTAAGGMGQTMDGFLWGCRMVVYSALGAAALEIASHAVFAAGRSRYAVLKFLWPLRHCPIWPSPFAQAQREPEAEVSRGEQGNDPDEGSLPCPGTGTWGARGIRVSRLASESLSRDRPDPAWPEGAREERGQSLGAARLEMANRARGRAAAPPPFRWQGPEPSSGRLASDESLRKNEGSAVPPKDGLSEGTAMEAGAARALARAAVAAPGDQCQDGRWANEREQLSWENLLGRRVRFVYLRGTRAGLARDTVVTEVTEKHIRTDDGSHDPLRTYTKALIQDLVLLDALLESLGCLLSTCNGYE